MLQMLKTKEEIEKQYFPGFLAFVDCTVEQPIPPRPKNRLRRRLYYSGKKKKHTHGKESVCSKPKGSYRLQIQAQTKR
jgi:hypothetical protein